MQYVEQKNTLSINKIVLVKAHKQATTVCYCPHGPLIKLSMLQNNSNVYYICHLCKHDIRYYNNIIMYKTARSKVCITFQIT